MRTRSGAAVLALAALLAGCTHTQNRELARYYDPQGLFSADLPAANAVSVQTAQPSGTGTSSILAAVVAAPPQPSPSSGSQVGGGLAGAVQQQPAGDQTLYEVLAVTTDGFASLDSMVLFFLTADPTIDVREDRPIRVGEMEGRLIVADARDSGSVRVSLAAAFTLGTGGVGYIVAAVFPPGGWAGEEPDFSRIAGSLSASVPPGLRSFPLAAS